ncbi:fluoride efflux transporter CrcB [Pyrofollis japonicus]|uniref:fluoride efflux transporter CrcB n=1 Tax=Pyrofollis japonicus TaxID=3060460 RepID=UPI00295B4656|nr:fluoride efflux transporter CrcB [Pyrofollis japonicus]
MPVAARLWDIALIALGGALGALARWSLASIVQNNHEFPIGTLVVNVLGSLLLGFVLGAASLYGAFTREQRLLLATGFAGAFTTFSTFMYESLMLLVEYSAAYAIAYIGLSISLGLAAVYLGYTLAAMVYKP